MATDAALLAEVPFFQLLDDQERADLAAQLHVASAPAGQVVFNAGDPGDALYVIRAGQVEVFIKNDTGERILLDLAGPGDFFGDLSLLDGGPRTATVVVRQDLEALVVGRKDLDAFLLRRPAAALDLLTTMGKRLRQNVELLVRTATRNVNEEVEDRRSTVERAADWIAEFSGSIPFLALHAGLFTVWIAWNQLPFLPHFDPFPFGLLTMCVSLEAIFLSVFVLLSQNRQVAKDRIRADIEYDVNLKAELEIAHLHEKVDRLYSETQARLAAIERGVAAK